ncbi:uncharacterized protein LOC102195312 [Pundamilia nyererei]|uniref:Uncharacterized protein LOC102195312 n=1 Tax=Pundamilia nyererei TaxID=303518 RepID=A0A9Y3S6Q1_9CICH|nr:PREDICTED: uncharacterized protein LOC102195312 [Pundamilia nyererei]
MQEACDRLLQGIDTPDEDKARGATARAPGGRVHMEVIQGSIESQQVDALVSPMVGHDPLSTRVGNTLFEVAGPQLTTRFRKEAEDERDPGDSVLLEGLPGLQSNAVFFLNLVPFDGDPDGDAVQVLRMGIKKILSSCEKKGFRSVALPVLGAGMALQFPVSVVERVLMEEVHVFEEERVGITPFLIRIVIQSNDQERHEASDVVQTDKFTQKVHNLGAPGPHAFLIVLRVDKFTEHEQAVVTKIVQYFSDEALKYAVVVFTHGDQLDKNMKIEDFVSENKNLSDLVSKCGGRCYVFDNKHWNNNQPNNYRSNQFQREELLKTIEKMVVEKNGGYYTNKMLQHLEMAIQKQVEHIRHSMPDKTAEEIRNHAKTDVCNRFLIQLTGIATGGLLGAFFGVAAMVGLAVTAMKNLMLMNAVKKAPALMGVSSAAAGQTALVVAGATGLGAATAGGVYGGLLGYEAANDAKSPSEAAQRTYEAIVEKGKSFIRFK